MCFTRTFILNLKFHPKVNDTELECKRYARIRGRRWLPWWREKHPGRFPEPDAERGGWCGPSARPPGRSITQRSQRRVGARGLEALPGDNFGADRTDALPLGPGEARDPPGLARLGRGAAGSAQKPSAPAVAAECGVWAQKRALPCRAGRKGRPWRAEQSGGGLSRLPRAGGGSQAGGPGWQRGAASRSCRSSRGDQGRA